MKSFIIFDDPALASEMRRAGFAVFKQRINGGEHFAAEDNERTRSALSEMKRQFGKVEFSVVPHLCF